LGNGAKRDYEKRFIGKSAYILMLRKSKYFSFRIEDGKALLIRDIMLVLKPRIKKFGTGAMIGIPKRYMDHSAFVIVFE